MKNLDKQILFIDLESVLMAIPSAHVPVDHETSAGQTAGHDVMPSPSPEAVSAYRKLIKEYDAYIVSDMSAVSGLRLDDIQSWLNIHFGKQAGSHMVITSVCNILKGDFLITRRRPKKNTWQVTPLSLGSKSYPDWTSIVRYLMPQPKPTNYDHIEQILTLELPLRKDTYRHVIKSENQPEYEEIAGFYSDVIDQKLEEIKAGKYGDLYREDMYDPASGWYEDTQQLTFDFEDFDVTVELTDACIDPEGTFNEVITHIECTVGYSDDEVPDYIQALEFEGHCEYECFEEALDTLFREIGKCKEKYMKEHEGL